MATAVFGGSLSSHRSLLGGGGCLSLFPMESPNGAMKASTGYRDSECGGKGHHKSHPFRDHPSSPLLPSSTLPTPLPSPPPPPTPLHPPKSGVTFHQPAVAWAQSQELHLVLQWCLKHTLQSICDTEASSHRTGFRIRPLFSIRKTGPKQ